MYSFLFKLDHEMLCLFLVCTDWEDIKCLDEFHVPQKDSFQLTEFMLLWRLAAGMLSLAFSFSLLLTAPKRGQSKPCQYAGLVTMTLKLTNLLPFSTGLNDQGFDCSITGALGPHIFFKS
ncbi:hypothetical protein RDI58_024306 [Solanum bulbocastanum]|uniref:Uncharacterized protein n=1 Tax=Solanum bulbocastanum TaxID=147425 RepID=A0AAN8SX99_SOLBU